jgi:hypothetical protein
MDVDSVEFNPSGDGWVGVVTADTAMLGGLGLALAGDSSLTNYSVEAEIYVVPDVNYYEALMVHVDTTGGVIQGYQLAATFNSGIERIRFRRFHSIPDQIVILKDWVGSDIPGGPPTEASWHTMQISVEDSLFRLFWDRQELPGGPYADTSSTPFLESGPFGVYVFSPFGLTQTIVDDILVRSTGTGIDDPGHGGEVPKAFVLGQNYPNPFNPATLIPFTIPPPQGLEGMPVRLSIFDLRGREIVKLVDGLLPEGEHRVAWNGRDARGRQVPSGIYIYNLSKGGDSRSRKMTLVK